MQRNTTDLFKGRHDAEIPLQTSCIVVDDIVFDHGKQFTLAGELLAIAAFSFENAPKAFIDPLSIQCATRDMLRVIPAASCASGLLHTA